ncbi:hypothetical protein [Trinickia fusca]|uniref:Uncharacterized protein n=1 Tax=Trinickia fusca TaxID=2419777 RepID=A0A494XAM0_9BURK|nr:hypothetical protein [Trinickia fusca]RKP47550.1 hypothetical protein D7S89_15090 [Trinickia fusca]
MTMHNVKWWLCVSALAATVAQPVMAACTMEAQMQNAQQAEQSRRLNNINLRMQTLSMLNQLETTCLQGFQAIPTQYIGNSTIAMAALNKIEEAACQSLANQARNTAQSALTAAQAQVQQQIDGIVQGITKSTGSTGMLSGNVAQSTGGSGDGAWSKIVNKWTGLFQ